MLDELTYKVRGCIFEVFKELGPGLLESVYESALAYEILNKGLHVQAQIPNYPSADSAISARDKNHFK